MTARIAALALMTATAAVLAFVSWPAAAAMAVAAVFMAIAITRRTDA